MISRGAGKKKYKRFRMVIAEEEDAEEADFRLRKTICEGKARGKNSVFR